MKPPGGLSQRISPKILLITLLVLLVPAVMWFRYLYMSYVVLPDQATPQQQKMADGMKQSHEKKPSTGSAKR